MMHPISMLIWAWKLCTSWPCKNPPMSSRLQCDLAPQEEQKSHANEADEKTRGSDSTSSETNESVWQHQFGEKHRRVRMVISVWCPTTVGNLVTTVPLQFSSAGLEYFHITRSSMRWWLMEAFNEYMPPRVSNLRRGVLQASLIYPETNHVGRRCCAGFRLNFSHAWIFSPVLAFAGSSVFTMRNAMKTSRL
jgi:hypothetical protein